MPQCPYCRKNISIELERLGGNCPSCHQYVLPSDDFEDDFATELIVPEHILNSDITPLDEESSEDFLVENIVPEEITEPITEEEVSAEEIVDAISKVPVILMDIPRDDLSAQKGYVFDEDSDESFLIQVEPPKPVSKPISPVAEELPSRPTRKKATGLDLKPMIFGFVFMMSIIGLFMLNQEEEEQNTNVDSMDMYIPEVKKGSIAPKEEKAQPKKSTSKSSSKSTKNTTKQPTTENLSGIETFSTSAPLGMGPTSSLPGNTQSTDRTQKDVENLIGNLRYCHTQALKKDSTISGKWELKFTISKEGKAQYVKVNALRKANSGIESCMKGRIARFKFAPVDSPVSITESIIFTP